MGKKAISFKADDELITQIERYAYKHKISRGEVIRRAVENLLEEELEKELEKQENPEVRVEKIS